MNESQTLSCIEEIANILEKVMCLSTPSSSSTKSPVSEYVDSGMFSSPSTGMLPAPARDGDRESSCKLSEVLGVLDYEEEANIFIVRRISKLGYQANDVLTDFFSQFGPLRRVLLLPSRGRGDSRLRPASMGFIVMEKAQDCSLICSSEIFQVNEVNIQVQKFTRNARLPVGTGSSSINALIPSLETSTPPPRFDDPQSHQYTISQVEMLAQAVIDTLRL